MAASYGFPIEETQSTGVATVTTTSQTFAQLGIVVGAANHVRTQNTGVTSIWFHYNAAAVVDQCLELASGEVREFHGRPETLAKWQLIAETSSTTAAYEVYL